MPGIDRRARHVGRPFLPGIERGRRRAGDPGIAPQRQHRNRDLLSRIEIRLVDVVVGIGAGTVVLAHRVDPRRVAKRREVMFQRARIHRSQRLRLGLARHLLPQEEFAIAADQRLRQRIRLRQERPVIDVQRIEPVHLLPVIIGRQDIEHREFRQPAGMIERQPVRHTPAAIVAGQRKMHMAELLHRLHHGLRHRALGVGRMVLVAVGHIRPAIARQIGDDQREFVGQLRRDRVPHHVGRGKPVQQQQRRPLAADAGEDTPRAGIDPFGGISGKQIGKIGHRWHSLAAYDAAGRRATPLLL